MIGIFGRNPKQMRREIAFHLTTGKAHLEVNIIGLLKAFSAPVSNAV